MPKRNRLSSTSYKSLMKTLQRAEYSKPGLLARTLLEVFVLDGGRWSADACIASGIVAKGGFSDLRAKLRRDGFLDYTEQSVMKKQYFPTARLMPHIDAARNKMYATLEVVEKRIVPVENDVAELKTRMAQIEKTVKDLKEALEPPITKAKKAAASRAIETLSNLTQH